MHRVAILVALSFVALTATANAAFDPAYEARNFAKGQERARVDYTPEFNVLLAQRGAEKEAEGAQILATDGPGRPFGRNFSGNLCANHMNGCAGDVRLYDWAAKGFGQVRPILFTARNGSTLSGHIWWTNAGPPKRPGVVITNGSVQAPEELYWFGAQALAKAGYVVMTWDPQGQGFSDTYGEGKDSQDGVPSQTGEPFYDGTEDALDFFFSSPQSPYVPRPSCSSGTSHADKQAARVADGRSSAYNPASAMLDTAHVGSIGQSLGAGAVSYIGQIDPRVQTIVAWDNLAPAKATSRQGSITCTSGSSPRPEAPPVRVPALGIAGDYPLGGGPKTSLPARDEKLDGFKTIPGGLDSGELVIRGGGHFEYDYIPNPAFMATSRGIDLTTWYSVAWMDRQLKADPTADARLLTTRWRADRLGREVDSQTPADGNLFSTYYDSPLRLGATTCGDLRKGCDDVLRSDGLAADFRFLDVVRTRDSGTTADSTTKAAGATGAPPAATGPGSSGQKAAECRDTTAPTSRITVAGRRTLRGTAADRGCAGAGRLAAVSVTVGRADGRLCRFVRPDGRLGARTSCKRTAYLAAKGTAAWSLTVKRPLPRGRYKLFSRGVDAAGNVERKARSRNFRRLTVR